MSAKIRSVHLSRPAVVYIRQSSLMQVLEHQESTERQYALSALAQRLGWDASQIRVIDEDLGKSGQSTENRSGFQRLVAEVSMGKVGAILSLEVSRLARSSADWHRLLDLCALSDTLILDDDGVYDPNDFHDRLGFTRRRCCKVSCCRLKRWRCSHGRRILLRASRSFATAL